MREQFIEKNFRKESIALIQTINEIIVEYENQGYELTLRQVYYQLVARTYIENNERSYKNVGALINDARLAGLIDWDAIVDRTRNIRKNSHWNSPADILRSALYSYKIDVRNDQPNYIEVWVEKDALISIVEGVASELDVPSFSCRGYVSQSEMYSAAQRIISHQDNQNCYILHLGDHDPSGIDMTRDIQERLELFGAIVEVERLALNWDQIELYQPPENPAKLTDSRSESYVDKYGESSYELDALEPNVIESLIRDAIHRLTDHDLLIARTEKQDEDKEKLESMIKSFS